MVSAETPQEFGEELRREREIREVSREELAAATKVSLRQIEALEAGRFDLLPARVFARGFVQAIAQHVGLDPERTGAAFVHVHEAWAAAEGAKRSNLGGSGTHPRLSRPRKKATLDTTALGVGIAIVLAAVTAVVAVVRARVGDKVEAMASRSAAVATPEPSSPAILSLPPAIAEASVALPAGSTLTTATSRIEAPVGVSGGRTLTLTFREDCWTEVSIDGKVVAAELCRKGATREFSGAQKFILTLGNAGGVDAQLDGAAVKRLGEVGQVVRNLVIDETLLAARG